MKRKTILSRITLLILISIIFNTICLNGCNILPSEEARYILPTIASQDIPEYNIQAAIRTDLIQTANINCRYSSGYETTDLCFNMSGLYAKKIYVDKGDKVSKGDLLMELDTGDLLDDISTLEQSLAENELELSYARELMELEAAKINLQYEHELISAKERKQAIESLENTYLRIPLLEETIYYDRLRLDELRARQNNAYIYAPEDGYITYINSDLLKNTYTKDQTAVSMATYSQLAFKAFPANRDWLTEGDIVTITMDKEPFTTLKATIVFNYNDSSEVFLYPVESTTEIEYNDKGSFNITISRRNDVIAIDSHAIKTGKNAQFVYYINEEGYRDVKPVTTGLKGDNGYIEILSGLNEGELVITGIAKEAD